MPPACACAHTTPSLTGQEDIYNRTSGHRARSLPACEDDAKHLERLFCEHWEAQGRPVLGRRVFLPVYWPCILALKGHGGRDLAAALFKSLNPDLLYFAVSSVDLGIPAAFLYPIPHNVMVFACAGTANVVVPYCVQTKEAPQLAPVTPHLSMQPLFAGSTDGPHNIDCVRSKMLRLFGM